VRAFGGNRCSFHPQVGPDDVTLWRNEALVSLTQLSSLPSPHQGRTESNNHQSSTKKRHWPFQELDTLSERSSLMESAGRIEPSDVTITSPDQFHKAILSDDCGPVKILLQVRTDGSLRRLSDTLNDNLANESSKSLAQILKSPGISSKQRLLLAYTIVKSFWQLYGSSWTRTSWTTEMIQLLSEDNKNDILYSSPFLDFSTQHPDCSLTEEPLREPSYIIHKYPRILGLAIILLEIAGERKASCQATSQPLQADTGLATFRSRSPLT
jgi:hypothetical protein